MERRYILLYRENASGPCHSCPAVTANFVFNAKQLFRYVNQCRQKSRAFPFLRNHSAGRKHRDEVPGYQYDYFLRSQAVAVYSHGDVLTLFDFNGILARVTIAMSRISSNKYEILQADPSPSIATVKSARGNIFYTPSGVSYFPQKKNQTFEFNL